MSNDKWKTKIEILTKDLRRLKANEADSVFWHLAWEDAVRDWGALMDALEEAGGKARKGKMNALYALLFDNKEEQS